MRFDRRWALGALLLAAGCAPKAPAPTVQDSMANVVAPQAQAIWDISNRAMNDQGTPDASKITEADWAKIAAAGQQITDRSKSLAEAKKVVVAAEGVKLQDEGGSGSGSNAKQVQGFIDANPAAFADHAKKLMATGETLIAASKAKDVAKLSQVSDSLDGVCEACHMQFWYPQQNAGK